MHRDTQMNRRAFLATSALGGLAGCCAPGVCANSGAACVPPPEKTFSYDCHTLRIDWPGLPAPLRFWHITDTHFALHDSRDDAYADYYKRMAQYGGSCPAFEKVLAQAQEKKPDLLVLTGDNISFPTLANVEYLKKQLDACGVPWIYTSGNHDWHFEGVLGSDIEQRAEWTKKRLMPLYQGADPLMASRVVKGVRFVMIDNSVYHVLPEQLAFWKQEAAKGDPICLCMHIPLWLPGWDCFTCGAPDWGAKTDIYWQIERRQRWDEKLLPATYEFREAVLDTPNLTGVFTGHIHRVQAAHKYHQNFFTSPAAQRGNFTDVRIG